MPNEYDQLLAEGEPDQATPPDQAGNEYDTMLASENSRRQSIMFDAVQHPPDTFAQAEALSRKTGLPGDLVLRNLDAVKKRADFAELQSRAALSPMLAEILANPRVAGMAHDDAVSLTRVESAVNSLKRGPKRLSQAISGMQAIGRTQDLKDLDAVEAQLKAGKEPHEIAPDNDQYGYRWMSDDQRAAVRARLEERRTGNVLDQQEMQRRIDALPLDKDVAAALAAPTSDEFWPKFWAAGPVKVLASIAPESIIASSPAIVAGAVAGPIGAGTGSFAIEYAFAIREHLAESGVDLNDSAAVTAALGDDAIMAEVDRKARARAATISAVSALSFGIAGRTLARTPLMNTLVQIPVQATLEASGEGLAQLAEGRSSVHFGEVAAEFIGGAGTAIPEVVAAGIAQRQQSRIERNQRSSERVAELTDLAAKAIDSKLKERNPQAFAEFIQEAAARTGEDIEHVYIDAQALKGALAQSELDPDSVPGLSEQLAQAADLGADVQIKVGDYAAHIVGSDIEQSISGDIRLDPDDLTANEQKAVSDQDREAFEKVLAESLEREQDREQAQADTDLIVEDVQGQLDQVNRFPGEVNQAYATMVGEFYRATAARIGMTPGELFAQKPLRVAGVKTEGEAFAQGQRGAFDPQQNLIALFKDADLSTFLHESGHFNLQMLEDLSATHPELQGDMQTLMDWFGVDSIDTWRAMSLDDKRVHHEKFARGFERYIFEGRSPNTKLTGLFRRFSAWLRTIYRTLRSLHVPMTNEVRGVMDRLLASDEEIELAHGHQDYAAMFGDRESAGMTPAEWSDYQAQEQRARDDAVDEVAQRSLNDMRWLTNAKSRLLKQMQREARDQRKVVQDEIRAQVEARPVYAVQRFLKRGEAIGPDGQAVEAEPVKISIDAVKSMYPDGEPVDQGRALMAEIGRAGGIALDHKADYGVERNPMTAGGPLFRRSGMQVDELSNVLRDRGYLTDADLADTTDNDAARRVAELVAAAVDGRELPVAQDQPAAGPGLSLPTLSDDQVDGLVELAEQGDAAAADELLARMTLAESRDAGKVNDLAANAADDAEFYRGIERIINGDQQTDSATTGASAQADSGANAATDGQGQAAATGATRAVNAAEILKRLAYGRNGMAAREGVHPDLVAPLFGFTSGDHLIQAIMSAEPMADVVSRETDAAMLQRYGDLNSPEAIRQAVNSAIANEARGRMIRTELRALQRANGGSARKGMIQAAKQIASEIIGRLPIKDIRPVVYAASIRKSAQKAGEAQGKGDTDAAITHKRNELVHHYSHRAAIDAKADVNRWLRYLKKFEREGTRKNIDPDYTDQIDALLERYNFKQRTQRQVRQRESLAAWLKTKEENGELLPEIDPKLIQEAGQQHYSTLTVDELRGLVDTVKSIEHVGRLKNRLITAQDKRDFDQVRDDMVSSINEHAKRQRPVPIEQNSFTDRARAKVREVFALHRKLSSLAREFDGWADGGEFWRQIVLRLNNAGDSEATMNAQATEALVRIMAPFQGASQRKAFIPAINQSLSLEARVAIALNWGNATNRRRVMEGDGWTDAQVQAILQTLQPEHWEAVQQVWDHLDSYWSQIAAKQRRVTGTAPERVQAAPFTAPTGQQMTGGYYPIKYDARRSGKAESHDAADVAKQMMQGAFTRSTTKRGHVQQRQENVKRPVRKDLGVIDQHLREVIHDLTHHEVLIDVNRLLADDDIQEAIRTGYSPEVLTQIKAVVSDIAGGDVPARNGLEQVLNHLRTGATIAGLGFNVATMLLQPTGLFQSAVRIGPGWVLKGAARWMADTATLTNTYAFINERSEFMQNRSRTLQREVNEISNQVRSKSNRMQVIEAAYFYGIQKLQLLADIPTWVGQYEKSLAAGESEAIAIKLADQAVIDAQASGQIKDLSGVQRGGPAWKLFTNFYSFFAATYNVGVESVKRTDVRDPLSMIRLAGDYLALIALPAIFGELIKQVLRGDELPEDEELAKWLISVQAGYLTGTMIGVRELSSAIAGFNGYSGPAGLRFFGEVSKLYTQAAQGEADAALFKALGNTIGVAAHLPSGQVIRSVEGAVALAEGDTRNPFALLLGPARD